MALSPYDIIVASCLLLTLQEPSVKKESKAVLLLFQKQACVCGEPNVCPISWDINISWLKSPGFGIPFRGKVPNKLTFLDLAHKLFKFIPMATPFTWYPFPTGQQGLPKQLLPTINDAIFPVDLFCELAK